MKRILMLLAVAALMAAMMAVMAGSALADAKLNDNNCYGALISGVASPDFRSHNQQGPFSKEQAQAGIRGEVLKEESGLFASCKNPEPF